MEYNIKLKPLFGYMSDSNLDSFLITPEFDRMDERLGFGINWELILIEVIKETGIVWKTGSGSQNEKKVTELGVFLFLNSAYETNIDDFFYFIKHLFIGYMNWGKDCEYVDKFINELAILLCPNKILQELGKQVNSYKIHKLKTEKVNIRSESIHDFRTNKIVWINKLSEAKIEEVIVDLKKIAIEANDQNLIYDVISQSSRWFKLQKKVQDGVIKSDDEHIESNKIFLALIEIINSL